MNNKQPEGKCKTTQAEYDAMLKAWYEANKDPDAQMAALREKWAREDEAENRNAKGENPCKHAPNSLRV
jgi:hypothetical protein